MIGILTEKPSAAANFATALGGMSGTYNGERYVIVNSVGHIYQYKDPQEQVEEKLVKKYRLWNLSNLPWNENDFSWKRGLIKGKSDVAKNIKSVLSQCSEVVIATDLDTTGEGTLLAWEILEELRIRPQKLTRMFFEDETPKEVQKGFSERKTISTNPLNDGEYVKALYRSKFDYMSMQFTRIATACGDGQSVLRQGRLKSAMVSMVGDALDAIKKYKKIPGYQNRFVDENGVKYSNPEEPSYPVKEQVPQIYQPSAVICDSKKLKHTAPPKMLDLATLSARLSSKGVKAETVLKVYQKMYEDHIVSYPRTDDKEITPEQFNELLPKVDQIARLVGVDPAILTHREPRKTHVKTGCTHGANRPGTKVPDSLESLKQYGACAPLIYEILARNYLATLAPDYEYIHQEGHLEKYPDFIGTTNIPHKMGFKVIFSDKDETEEKDEDESSLGLGTMAQPYVHEFFPPKPPTPTMNWLMKQLEKHDVGTGSTRTGVYAEVTTTATKYPLLIDTKGKLSMTEYGQMSYMLLSGTHIGDLKITEDLQADMRAIAVGQADPAECLRKMQQMVINDISVMQVNGEKMRKTLNITMDEKAQRPTKPKHTGIWSELNREVTFTREWGGHVFTDIECKRLLLGETIIISAISSKGKLFKVKGKLSIQEYKGRKFVGFENLGFVETFPEVWCGHRFTDDEKNMLESGMPVHIEGCISKKTKKIFSTTVIYIEVDGRKCIQIKKD